MKRVEDILNQIDKHKQQIASGKLFQLLSDNSIDGQYRLSFAPSMLYYLMGFKDVLGALKRVSPKNDMEKAINAYCGEDAEHWRWFLQDLEKLGFNLETWGKTISQWCNEVWSSETEINRKTIFNLIRHANSCRHPIYSLAMIWVFEATGVVFIGHTQKAAVDMGMDEELYYLGRTHFEEEFGHSVVAQDYADVEIEDTLYDQICSMVDELFNDYVVLFDCWYEHRGKYNFAKKLLQHAA